MENLVKCLERILPGKVNWRLMTKTGLNFALVFSC